MKKKKNNKSKKYYVITKNHIVFMLVCAIVLLNLAALAFAMVDATEQHLGEASDRYFVNGFVAAFGECPVIVESYENLISFYCICHFVLALVLILAVGLRFATRRDFKLGKLAWVSVVFSFIFTTLYFVIGCIAYSDADDYADLYYSVSTFSFIPFALMIVLVASFILVKIKLPVGYKIKVKKKQSAE